MTKENIEEVEEEEEDEPRSPDCSFSLLLNKFFHHIDRGSHLRSEVLSGIVLFLVSICVLFVNMQIVGHSILGDLTISTSPLDPNSIAAAKQYVALYQGALIVSFISAIVIGLFANLPLVQLSLMGLSTSLIGLLGIGNGLTYYNLLFISWISSIVTAIIVGVPQIKRFILKGLPKPLLHALPLLNGIILILLGTKLSGFFGEVNYSTGNLATNNLSLTGFSLASLKGPATIAFIASIVAFISFFVFRSIKAKHPFAWSFLIGFGLFLIVEVIQCAIGGFSTADESSYINFGRIWLIAGSQASDKTPYGDSFLTYGMDGLKEIISNLGLVFTKGSDFSAYQGNSFLLITGSVLSLTLFNLVDPQSVLQASEEDLSEGRDVHLDFAGKDSNRIYWINSGINFIAPFFGVGMVSVSKTSLMGTKDKAKSGIVPLIAGIGYLVSIFFMAFAPVMASETYAVTSMNEFNYFAYGNGGFVYLVQGLKFGFADAILCLIGISMIETSIHLLAKDEKKYYLVAAALLSSLIFSNLVVGLFASLLTYLLINLFETERVEGEKYIVTVGKAVVKNIKTIEIPVVVMLGVSILALAL